MNPLLLCAAWQAGLFSRRGPVTTVACFGGGGGSADQTQTQQTTTDLQQSGASDQGADIRGDNNTVIHQSLSEQALQDSLTASSHATDVGAWVADQAITGNAGIATGALTLGGNAAILGAAVTGRALDTADTTINSALAVASHAGDNETHIVDQALAANAGLTTGAMQLSQNFGVLTAQAAGAAHTAMADVANRSVAQNTFLADNTNARMAGLVGDVIGGQNQLAGEVFAANADLAGKVIAASDGVLKRDQELTRVNAQGLQNLTDSTLGRIADLAKTTSTGGAVDANKNLMYVGLALAAAVGLMALNRK